MNLNPEPHSSGIWQDRRLWIIIAIAIALGLAATFPFLHETTPRLMADDLCYHSLAKTLLEEGRFTSTYRPPGYPVFVALVYAVCGPHPFAVYAVQCVLFGLSLAIIANIFYHITDNRTIALMAAAGGAIYPFFYIEMLPFLLTETLALFEIALFLYILQKDLARPSWSMSCILGVVFAAACFTKPVLLPFAIITGIGLTFLVKEMRTGIRHAALFMIVVAFCIAPWTYRNLKETGAIIPIATGSGVNFWIGNYPGNYDRRWSPPDRETRWPQLPSDLAEAVQGMSEVERDVYLQSIAMGYIRKDPIMAASLFVHKFCNLWLGHLGTRVGNYPEGQIPMLSLGPWAITRTSLLITPIFILALVGIWLLKPKQRKRMIPVIVLMAWFTFCYVAVVVEGRYAFPVFPYALGFAAISVFHLVSWTADRLTARGTVQ